MRKVIFIAIILTMTLSFAGFYIVPAQPQHQIPIKSAYILSTNSTEICNDAKVICKFEIFLIHQYKNAACSSIPKKESATITDPLNVPVTLIHLQDI